jgi:Domain of unknown function (DUF4359)
MKKSLLIILSLFSLFLVVTNPKQEAYVEYLWWKLQENSCDRNSPDREILIACNLLQPTPKEIGKTFIKGYVRRQNYILFSVYTTRFLGMKNSSVGIGGFFLD